MISSVMGALGDRGPRAETLLVAHMLAPECAITLRVSNENLMELHEAILRYEHN